MILKEIMEHIDNEQDQQASLDITFREKDAHILKQICQSRYQQYKSMLTQKTQCEEKLIKLKEELCRISPQALEEIERDCFQKYQSEEDAKAKKSKSGKNNKNIKKNERRKKPQKLSYS